MAWEEDFVYPLYLLFIGAGVSDGLVALLGHYLEGRRREREFAVEDRKKELDIKVDIASKMSEAMGHLMASASIAKDLEIKTHPELKSEGFYENLKKWSVDSNIIASKLESYFPEGIKGRWKGYVDVLVAFYWITAYYYLKDLSKEDKDEFRFGLEFLKDYFKDSKQIEPKKWHRFTMELNIDENLWNEVRTLILQSGDEIIKDVLKLAIKAF